MYAFYFYLHIYIWLCWVFIAVRLFSSCGKWGLPSSCDARASLCGAQAVATRVSVAAACGVSSCGSWALEYKLSNCRAWA